MRFRSVAVATVMLMLWLVPQRAPAPLIYRPGEGWTYESVGGARWERDRAKDQLEVAREAFEAGNYRLATKAARRVVRVWPLSDFAPAAQYLVGRSYEERGQADRAFRAYQQLIDRYPKLENYDEVLKRQFDIATLYLNGKWFYLWRVIPLGPDRDRVVDMYEAIIRNGPYSDVAPTAQMNIGTAREIQREWQLAVRAYERAADRYHDQPSIASDAYFRAGMAQLQEAEEAEYDQSAASKAIDAFTDFIALYPSDPRVEEARRHITELQRVRADGSYRIARYYERKNHLDGAVIYYAEVVDIYTRVINEPDAPLVAEARERIAEIGERRARLGEPASATPTSLDVPPAPGATNAPPFQPVPTNTPPARPSEP